MPRKKTPADYHALAEERGFRWLGPEAPNNRTKTGWECEHGHQWKAHYNSVQQGSGCPFCAGKIPKTPADYHTLAKKQGFLWLGPEVSSIQTKTGWKCGKGHHWEARYASIQQGHGCPFCAGVVSKTSVDYHALAEERGFHWLGPEVPNVRTMTGWECGKGHHWEAIYANVRQGSGCPFCAGKASKIPADYHALAKERGFRWLGPESPNVSTKTSWECKQGHQWEATYASVQRGTGCPFCAGKAPKTPADYYALAEERGFRWLGPEVSTVHSKTGWECIQEHHWEAPYSSIQQGSGCPFCAGIMPKTPTDYHKLAEKQGFRWLGSEVSGVHTKTSWECQQGHQWETSYSHVQRGRGCPFCAGKAPKTSTDYYALAEKRGFHWLGPEVPNVTTTTGWECKQGHQWEAAFHAVQRGTGCPFCAGKAPKTPADYYALAEERGFRWLGPEVRNAQTKTGWECEQGHRWEAPYSSVQQGSGCLICAGKAPKIPADYHALAGERGFRWFGPEVPNVLTKTGWECEQGHRWEARYSDVRKGRGCPVCVDMVQGARVSQVQRDLCEMLNGELNFPFDRYNIDVAIRVNDVAIAVEYDSWFWHGHNQEYDAQRDEQLIEAGWCMLRVKSNILLPSQEQLDAAIAYLLAGEKQVEIVLDDWGVGPTRFEVD